MNVLNLQFGHNKETAPQLNSLDSVSYASHSVATVIMKVYTKVVSSELLDGVLYSIS